MAHGYVLHVGDVEITLQNTCNTEHTLNVKIGDEIFCAEMTSDTVTERSLRTKFGDTVWTVCNSGACGGGVSDWVMPEVPDAPIQLPSNCNWEQTNTNAYLLSDGRQWFDTGVPVDTANNIEVTVQVINGNNARIFGTKNSSCYYDLSLAPSGVAVVRMGTNTTNTSVSLSAAQRTAKNTWTTETIKSTTKRIKLNGTNKIQKDLTSACSVSNTIMVFNGDAMATIDPTLSGGIKLYNIKLYNSSGTKTHDFQPVAAGTNICGETAATNAMWDLVTKKLYYPGGTGQMGYGVDP